MSRFEMRLLQSLEQLRAAARSWDDLWRRSDVASPELQAELVALWSEQFARPGRFRAVVVAEGERLVAALPLVGKGLAGWGAWGTFPANAWCGAGDLLLDPHAPAAEVVDALVSGLRRLPWPLVRLDAVPYTARRWQALLGAVQQAGLAWTQQPSYSVGRVELEGDWAQYEQRWSGNHRRHLRKALKRAQCEGELALRLWETLGPDEVEPLLRRGFGIEDRSWKGAQGTSVVRTPGLLDFFCRQARQLAAAGQLRLALLELAGHDIAFLYGFAARHTLFTPKIGYDESFADFSPGQLLWFKLFEQLHRDQTIAQLDFSGVLAPATARWATSAYPVARVTIATGSVLGRVALAAGRAAGALRRRLRGTKASCDEPQPGVRPRLDLLPAGRTGGDLEA